MGTWLLVAVAALAQDPPARLAAAEAAARASPDDPAALDELGAAFLDARFALLDARLQGEALPYRAVAWTCESAPPPGCIVESLEMARRSWHLFEARDGRFVSVMEAGERLRVLAGTFSSGARVRIAVDAFEILPATPELVAALSVGARPGKSGAWDRTPLDPAGLGALRELPALWHPIDGWPDDPHIAAPCEGKDHLTLDVNFEGLYRLAYISRHTPGQVSLWSIAEASKNGKTWSFDLPAALTPGGVRRVEVEYPAGRDGVSRWTGLEDDPLYYAVPGVLERREGACD